MSRCAVLLLVACGGGAETAVRVRVDLEPGVVAQQLRFIGTAGSQTVFGPALRPEAPAGQPLESGGELRVLLPDALHGRELSCGVAAVDGPRVIAWSEARAQVQAGAEVECHVVLTASPCGGCVERGRCERGDQDDRCGTGGAACTKCEHGAKCRSGRCVE